MEHIHKEPLSPDGVLDEDAQISDLQARAITVNDKPPALLKAIELILADPAEIMREADGAS